MRLFFRLYHVKELVATVIYRHSYLEKESCKMKQEYAYPVNAPTTPSNRVLTKKEVIRRASLSKSTIYEYIQRGIFPAPIKIGLRRVGWLESDVDDWLEKRKTQSRLGLNND